MRRIRRRLACERGDALIEGLFALALVLLVVAVAAQALAYAHARSVAAAAAQDGARAAAAAGPEAGIAWASAILTAAGDTGRGLRATARENGDEVTVRVEGEAPRLFSLPLLLPAVEASASLPLERYPAAEAAP
jgi:type II secretory pathway component PulK